VRSRGTRFRHTLNMQWSLPYVSTFENNCFLSSKIRAVQPVGSHCLLFLLLFCIYGLS